MNTVPKQLYEEVYQDYERERYLGFLSSLSDNIQFENNTWICEKRLKSKAQLLSKATIYFSKIPEKYNEMVKFYAIIRLHDGLGVATVASMVSYIAIFLNWLGETSFEDIIVTTASRFKEYLDGMGYAESSKASIWAAVGSFLRRTDGYDGIQSRNPFYKNIYGPEKLLDYKYIPEDVAKQLDCAFMGEDIPVTIRCIYWLLRLIPSRISEILGMKIDCLKPFDRHYCTFIPTWKQNGGYMEPIMRVIHVNDEGMGAHLMALIREQQKMALSYQEYLPEDKRGALFAYRAQIRQKGVWYTQNRYTVASWVHVSYHLKEICIRCNIRDESGAIYKVTSHQFRHNGITDRLRAGFTLPQIAKMTAHHGDAMIYASYAHLNLFPETLVEPLKYETETEHPYVLFGGRILNMDAITESRLLKNIRAHRVPGGICADVTNCKSGLWSCIDCEHFVPEVEQLPYFKEQGAAWDEKADRFKNDTLLYQNYTNIALKFKRIVENLEGECYNEER